MSDKKGFIRILDTDVEVDTLSDHHKELVSLYVKFDSEYDSRAKKIAELQAQLDDENYQAIKCMAAKRFVASQLERDLAPTIESVPEVPA